LRKSLGYPFGGIRRGLSDASPPQAWTAPSVSSPGSRYDAFISYSHAADGKLAPTLHDGLQRFATPWRALRWANPVRALRVFQDQASLSANPGLWPTIERALTAAEWFVLLASPEAAKSPWVGKEIDFWCRNKSPERLLIVQTDGEIAWDHARNDFDRTKTTALPERLRGVFADEPRWIEARWARTAAHASLRDPRFRDLVAELAAPLRGVPKDELIGEDIRQHRRLNRWRNVALAVVTTLLIGAIAAAAVAVQQSKAAIRQRDQALRNESKALAALAGSETEKGSPASAARLALAALPRSVAKPNRPPVAEAEYALYLAMVRNREVERVAGHAGGLTSAAFSPDAQLIVTASADGTAGIWKFGKGLIAVLGGHQGPLYGARFSPDGHVVITASLDGTARLWETASGRELVVLDGHEKGVQCATFSPDGRTVATGSEDHTARLWDAATGEERHVLRGHKAEVRAVTFAPDGRTLVTASFDGTAAFWDAATGNKVGEIAEAETIFTSVALSPDGRTLAVASGNKARLWDLATSKEIGDLRGHDQLVNSVAFSADGLRLVTASLDGTIRLWDAATLKEIAVLRGHEEPVFSATFSPDGTAALSASGDLTARLWDVTPRRELLTLSGHEDSVRAAGFSPDGRTVLTASQDGSARLWNLVTGAITVLRGHEGPIRTAAFSPDGRIIVSGSADNTVRTWHAATGEALKVLHGHEGAIDNVKFASDGRTIVSISHADETARLWDLESGMNCPGFAGGWLGQILPIM
jgi:WD40 repeat protein